MTLGAGIAVAGGCIGFGLGCLAEAISDRGRCDPSIVASVPTTPVPPKPRR